MVANIRLDNRQMRITLVMREIFKTACTAVVDNSDVLPFGEQAVNDMRADEAAAAGDNGFHMKKTPF